MSTIKDAVSAAMDVIERDGPDEYTNETLGVATAAARAARAAIFKGYRDLRIVGLAIQHRTLRTILMRLHGVNPVDGEKAFNARLKHILDLGLIEDRRGKGERRRTYGLVDVLEIALCLQMQRSYVPPATAVRFIIDNRVHLDKFWSEGPLGRAPWLYIEVDAFTAIGGTGRESGRGSRGNEAGTIRLGRLASISGDAVPPSTLVIDTADLQRRVDNQLVQTGVREAIAATRKQT